MKNWINGQLGYTSVDWVRLDSIELTNNKDVTRKSIHTILYCI